MAFVQGSYEMLHESLHESLMDERNRTVIVLGGPDTGKTTFIEALADRLSRRWKTGIADLDMGQSHIGPPTTVAWGAVSGGFRGWKDIEVEDFYFTGSLSPPGSLLPALAGAMRIVDKASRGCDKLLVDTTGLVSEPIGRVFKQYKIEALRPDIVVALERAGELSGILDPLRNRRSPIVFRLPVPPGVSSKSPAKRAEYRAARFREYFGGSGLLTVPEGKTAMIFTREKTADISGRAVSFRDEDGDDIAIGIAEGRDPTGGIIIRTPARVLPDITALVVGSAVITL